MPRRVIKIIYLILINLFGLIGLIFVGVFIAMQLHLTNVPGAVDARSDAFAQLAKTTTNPTATAARVDTTAPLTGLSDEEIAAKIDELQQYQDQLKNIKDTKQKVYCQLQLLAPLAGENTKTILQDYQTTGSVDVVNHMLFALEPYISSDYVTTIKSCDDTTTLDQYTTTSVTDAISASPTANTSQYLWVQAPEWPVLHEAVTKDADVINKVSTATGVPARLIVGALVVEQLRLYHTQREYYEKYFAPLKILANATSFAWGVMSIKEAAAKDIESQVSAADAHLLAFTTADHDAERLARLTDEHNHYYSYLYGALMFKELTQQWQTAGFDISNRPEILITLFNIGFGHSNPNANPQVGGSTIEINNHNFTFGGLGYEVYYSGEFTDQFPY